jgi:dolichyl-phosphate-mannose-protein mannosyltransferase
MLDNRRLIIVSIMVILALSAGVRFYRLGTPKSYIFDEVYYAEDAKTILKGRVGPTEKAFPWEPGKEVSWPHPEWGKFLIAGGILLFGDTAHNAFGWRFASAVAGLAIIAAVYPLARRLGLAPVWALLALALAAADTLGIAQSRIATLDIFVGLWTVLCLLFTLRYAQDGRRLRWLVLSGVAGGLALGTKWSGAYVLLAALVLLFLMRSRPAGEPGAGAWPKARAPVALLVALPIGLYVASYWQYFAAGHTWGQWRELQRQMVQFNLHLHASHHYASLAPTWIADYRPVWYYYVSKHAVVHGVVSIGNAFLWWTALACLLVLPFVALRRRSRGLAIAPLLVAILYFPWFLTTRTSFMYYMTPVAPMLAVLVATAIAAANGVDVRLPAHPPWEPVEPEVEPAGSESRREPEKLPAYGKPVGEPEPRRGRRAPVWGRRWALVLLVASLAVMTPLWYPLGQVAKAVFWSLPQAVSPALAWGVIVTAAGFGVVLALVLLRYAPAGEPAPGPSPSPTAPVWERRWALVLFVAGLALMTLLWYRSGHLLWYHIGPVAKAVFWSLPQAVSPALAWGVSVTAAVLAAAAVIGILLLPPLRDLRRQLLWAWSGAVVGWCFVYLPIVLALGISSTHFYRLMWFLSWI